MATPLSPSEMNAWTQGGLAQQANRNTQYRYGEQTSPQQQQQQQPQGGGGGRMLGNMFSGNGLMADGHAGFGGAMQGAMGQMWDINKRNQDASLALSAMGGGGGGGQPAPWKAPDDRQTAWNIAEENRKRQNDFSWQQKMRNQQLQNSKQWQTAGFQYPGSGGGPLGSAFTTNYGAYGNVSNPTMGGGIF